MLQRHALKCSSIADQELPDDPDQRTPGATPSVEQAMLGRTDLFDPAARLPSVNPPTRSSSPSVDEVPDRADAEQEQLDAALNLALYRRSPDREHQILICITCGVAVLPSQLELHVHLHFPIENIPTPVVERLVEEFNVHRDFKLIPIPRTIPPPIFGLTLDPTVYFFCSRCGHGYSTRASLRSHQNSPERCPRQENEENSHTVGYGQQFTRGRYQMIFQVNPHLLPQRSDDDPPIASLFTTQFPPTFDYSNLPFVIPERDLDLSSFARSEGWLTLIEGMTATDIAEVIRGSTGDDGDLHDLKPLVVGYVENIQREIKQHSTYGMQRLMANVGLTNHSLAGFNILEPESCQKYGLTLWQLVFGVIRQYRGELGVYKYPLTRVKHQNIHRVINSLFSHIKNDNRLGKFFSAVCCYAVFISIHPQGHLLPASSITSKLMHLIYLNRTTQMTEMRRLMDENPALSVFQAYEKVKVYLQDMQETPMAWLFNHHSSRSIIRANEYTDAGASFMDEHGRELTLDGKLIRLSDFTTLMDNLQTDYGQHVKDEIFFGENLPEQLKLTISLRDIADNPHNRSAGWCFLDHPDNPFHNFQNSYGEWLLSDPERADTFTYIHEG
ncbi:hypothetical protein B0H13DRAFT_2370359 [Mycena leptocephala]|nr:hypothetical protein B0H13DRAFT_2370359 [Mycena leptocephala]